MTKPFEKHSAVTKFFTDNEAKLPSREKVNQIISEFYLDLGNNLKLQYNSSKKWEQSCSRIVPFLEVGCFVLPYEECLKLYKKNN